MNGSADDSTVEKIILQSLEEDFEERIEEGGELFVRTTGIAYAHGFFWLDYVGSDHDIYAVTITVQPYSNRYLIGIEAYEERFRRPTQKLEVRLSEYEIPHKEITLIEDYKR